MVVMARGLVSCTSSLLACIAWTNFTVVTPFLSHRRVPITYRKQDRRCDGSRYSSSFKLASDSAKINECISADDDASFYHCLIQRFQGDFDNYNQVVQDRRRGLLPAEGGGHEHIHCTLVPCPKLIPIAEGVSNQDHWVIAAFYLNGNPKQIFRFRMYRMIPPQLADDKSSSSQKSVRLKLHTINPELDQTLRGCSERPWTWWREVYNMWSNPNRSDAMKNTPLKLDQWQKFQSEGLYDMVSLLKGCDVLWNPEWNPSNHSYLYQDEYDDSVAPSDAILPENAFHATMEAGPDGVIVDSISMIPGKRILIKDELSLWKDKFWINDRGYDPDATVGEKTDGAHNVKDSGGMPYVYGNRKGIPYKLDRVACMRSETWKHSEVDQAGGSLTLHREVVNPQLEWTLGDQYRTPTLYQQKLNSVQ